MAQYAIIEVGGRQWRVAPGSRVEINRIGGDAGHGHVVEQVLLVRDGERLEIGRPWVPGAQVLCDIAEHRKGPKTIAYHFRRRENWRKTVGHRQPLTRLVVKEILLGNGKPAANTSHQ